jgi:CRP-like cAMP-binding protein
MDLITAIDAIHSIDAEAQQAILEVAKRRILPKGTLLLNEGDISNQIYFIEQGLVRGFYHVNKKEITSWVISDGSFVWPLPSYLLQRPSGETIQLLEETIVVSIYRQDMLELRQSHQIFNELRSLIMERYIILYDKRVQMLLLKAEERLDAYKELFPDLYQRIPQRYIATYLGIDPATLSRIRGNYRN